MRVCVCVCVCVSVCVLADLNAPLHLAQLFDSCAVDVCDEGKVQDKVSNSLELDFVGGAFFNFLVHKLHDL